MVPSRTPARPRLGTRIALAVVLATAGLSVEAGFLDRLKEKFGSSEEPSARPGEEHAELTEDQVGRGLKEALSVGIDSVIERLGAIDGFNLDPEAHIPLPGKLDKVRDTLEKFGMAGQFEELELGLNRAAEVAVPKSRELLQGAVQEMTLEDAMGILRGPDDAATRYFRGKMSEPLKDAMRPIVDDSLSQVGAAALYGNLADRYNRLPMVEPVDADLAPYVLEEATSAVFMYLAREEAAIRADPVKRTTDLLKRVFGG